MIEEQLIMLKNSLKLELENAPWKTRETLVTRGAFMCCSKGTHEEILNQPKSNGVYINTNPLMTVEDCKVSTSEIPNGTKSMETLGDNIDGNLYSFGYCRSEMHPAFIRRQQENDNSFVPKYNAINDYDPDTGQEMFGQFIYPCIPEFASGSLNPLQDSNGPRWENGSKSVFINGVPALTNKSCLQCVKGGTITFLTNGMEMPPFEFVEHYIK